MKKAELLDTAKAAVADRGLNYGTPEDNFARIAKLWNAHLVNRHADRFGGDTVVAVPKLTASDVAMMMVLMKVARLENSPGHEDSWIDIAGYAACGVELGHRQMTETELMAGLDKLMGATHPATTPIPSTAA